MEPLDLEELRKQRATLTFARRGDVTLVVNRCLEHAERAFVEIASAHHALDTLHGYARQRHVRSQALWLHDDLQEAERLLDQARDSLELLAGRLPDERRYAQMATQRNAALTVEPARRALRAIDDPS